MAENRMKLQNTMNDELQMDFHGVPTELELPETLLSLIPARLNVNLGLLSLCGKITPRKKDNGIPQLP